jgi:predicted membrane-bound spermidine synthase
MLTAYVVISMVAWFLVILVAMIGCAAAQDKTMSEKDKNTIVGLFALPAWLASFSGSVVLTIWAFNDGPWQFQTVGLTAIIGSLVALMFHAA